MNHNSQFDALRHRDGTSQRKRQALALNPDYFLVDEQSIGDLLDFAREYGQELKYFNRENQHRGFWTDFLPDDNEDILTFLKNPKVFDDQPDKKARFAQPHFVLFLTFLQLLQQPRQELNLFTRRHLEFYYREALQLQEQAAQPDHVHLLVDVASGVQEALVPKRTKLLAGLDSEGNDLLYETETDLVANAAKITQKMTLYVDKEVTTLAAIRDQLQDEPDRMRLELLRLTVRSNGLVPDYTSALNDPSTRILDEELLADLEAVLRLIPEQLGLRFSEFRELMSFYFNRKESEIGSLSLDWEETLEGPEWTYINGLLSDTAQADSWSSRTDPDLAENARLGFSLAAGSQQFIAGAPGTNQVQFFSTGQSSLLSPAVDGLDAESQLGKSVAMAEPWAAVGAPAMAVDGHEQAGKVLILQESDPTVWASHQELVAPGAQTNAQFGSSVALFGNTLLVGAPGEGKVYVFELQQENEQWEFLQALKAPGDSLSGRFGESLILNEQHIVVGAPGEIVLDVVHADEREKAKSEGQVFIFERPDADSIWIHQTTLQSTEPQLNGHFGNSLTLQANKLLIGANREDSLDLVAAGKAYLFESDTNQQWEHIHTFLSPQSSAGGHFGSSLAITPEAILISAPGESVEDSTLPGRVYLYDQQTDGQLLLMRSLEAPETQKNGSFGTQVAMLNHSIVIANDQQNGVPPNSNNPSEGAAQVGKLYAFERLFDSSWQPTATPRNFQQNFISALHFDPLDTSNFEGIAGVSNIYELYEKYQAFQSREHPGEEGFADLFLEHAIEFLNSQFTFPDKPTFLAMMRTRMIMIREWKAIIKLLENAALRIGQDHVDHTHFEEYLPDPMAVYLREILHIEADDFGGVPNFNLSNLESYRLAMSEQEDYFALDSEEFLLLRRLAPKGPDWQWDEMYEMLTRAHQSKNPDLTDARPELVDWQNLYLARDAASLEVHKGLGDDLSHSRWKTFGRGYDTTDNFGEPGRLGLAILSPILALAEGNRRIALSLELDVDGFNIATEFLIENQSFPFHFCVSTAKEMIPAPLDLDRNGGPFEVIGNKLLLIHLLLSEEVPPIVPLEGPEAMGEHPMIQILLTDLESPETIGDDTVPPKTFKMAETFLNVLVHKIRIDVQVEGIQGFSLQNNNGMLNPKKPFEPFTSSPLAGQKCYLSHPEIIRKKLDTISLQFDWVNLPETDNGLGDYYKSYVDIGKEANLEIGINSNADFLVAASFWNERGLLDEGTAGNTHVLFPPEGEMLVEAPFTDPNYRREPSAQIEDEVLNNPRYLQLELLTPDFQEENYPLILTRLGQLMIYGKMGTETISPGADKRTFILANKPIPGLRKGDFVVETAGVTLHSYDEEKSSLRVTVERTEAITVKYLQNSFRDTLVNPPFIPQMQHLRLNYKAHLEIELKQGRDTSIDHVYHLHPFGYNEIEFSEGFEEDGIPLFPFYRSEARLYLGVEDLRPPQVLSVLFQLAEGSANPDLEQAEVQWHYRSKNSWKPLGEAGLILSDTTQGLLTSGIIQFKIPEDAIDKHTHIYTGYHWIRAIVARNSESLSDTIAIETQAVRAVFKDRDNAVDHYDQPLVPGTITGADAPLPEVKAFVQPFSSFLGKPPEAGQHFYTRVAERLRHKQRALNMWDYERLVLEAFPDIYKVKCIPADILQSPQSPGELKVVIIPNIRGRMPFDPFAPKVAVDRLQQVDDFLQRLSSPWANITVCNPVYYPLQIRLGARFRDANTDFYKKQLELELKKYLTPWAFDPAADIALGRVIFPSRIVEFLDAQPYVDYVAELSFIIFRYRPDGILEPIHHSTDESIVLDRPDAILVSAPTHDIVVLKEPTYDEDNFVGIGYMRIEIDFQVDDSPIQI